jgi:hypothetical protein
MISCCRLPHMELASRLTVPVFVRRERVEEGCTLRRRAPSSALALSRCAASKHGVRSQASWFEMHAPRS